MESISRSINKPSNQSSNQTSWHGVAKSPTITPGKTGLSMIYESNGARELAACECSKNIYIHKSAYSCNNESITSTRASLKFISYHPFSRFLLSGQCANQMTLDLTCYVIYSWVSLHCLLAGASNAGCLKNKWYTPIGRRRQLTCWESRSSNVIMYTGRHDV